MENHKALYRVSDERKLGGVAAGLARYMNIDPVLVRIAFVVTTFFGGIGMFVYALMWMFVRRDVDVFDGVSNGSGSLLSVFFKALGILICVVAISDEFDNEVGTVAFIIGLAIGMFLYWRSSRIEAPVSEEYSGRMYRTTSNKVIFGVFGGLARSMGIDPTLARVLGVVLLVCGVPFTLLAYLLLALVMPKEETITRFEGYDSQTAS